MKDYDSKPEAIIDPRWKFHADDELTLPKGVHRRARNLPSITKIRETQQSHDSIGFGSFWVLKKYTLLLPLPHTTHLAPPTVPHMTHRYPRPFPQLRRQLLLGILIHLIPQIRPHCIRQRQCCLFDRLAYVFHKIFHLP